MKKILFIIVLAAFAHFGYHHFFKRTKGFCIEKILSSHSYNPKWDVGPLRDEEKALLDSIENQTFSYLDSGKETYAFVSEDGKYVIKFFKQKHMDASGYFDRQFPNLRRNKIIRRQNLRQQTFESYLIAYNILKEETGILYLHLNQTDNLDKKVTFIDQHNLPFILNLDKMEFLIQKRAKPVFLHLNHLITTQDMNSAKDAIQSLLNLITIRIQKGISDADLNCERNLGFIENQAIEIDIGEFTKAKNLQNSYKKELAIATQDLQVFLHDKAPELEDYLLKQIKRYE